LAVVTFEVVFKVYFLAPTCRFWAEISIRRAPPSRTRSFGMLNCRILFPICDMNLCVSSCIHRFDFSCNQNIRKDELENVERVVNDVIRYAPNLLSSHVAETFHH
jgi:hypothetical protein